MVKINLKEKLSKFTDHWSPRIIAEMNDYQFKLVKIKGDFVWHNHDDTDEVFIVLEGEMKSLQYFYRYHAHRLSRSRSIIGSGYSCYACNYQNGP